MKTQVILDEALIHEAMDLTGTEDKQELVQFALEELIKIHKKKNLLDLVGRLEFRDDYDHKALRNMTTKG